LFQCSKEGLWNKHFTNAESKIQSEWSETIWPLIQDFDFDSVLELAPGAGRNTERLCEVSKRINVVDYNAYALEQCRERLGQSWDGCDIEYHVNNGTDLKLIADGVISAVYWWDAAVHFDKAILSSYIREFGRVLREGGKGFVHHSNLGDSAHKNINKNPEWRSNMSKESFAEMCETNGLRVVTQVDIP
jgi:ubiquinone/menaquinone biosynthesis C-methylase UbiE